MLTTFQIVLFTILGILLFFYFVIKIRDYFRGKVALESKMQLLKPEETYEVVYHIGIFGNKKIYSIVPNPEHRTTLTETTYYNGRIDIRIQASINNMIIYSVYLKNVRALYSSENKKSEEVKTNLEDPKDD